jgi:hypothetical protein
MEEFAKSKETNGTISYALTLLGVELMECRKVLTAADDEYGSC